MLINGTKSNYISFEYIGPGSVPMHVVYISTKPIPSSEQVISVSYSFFPINYIVNNNEFAYIKELINSTRKKDFDTTDYSGNGFKTTISENNTLVTYFITRKNSDSLFLKANAYLKQDTSNKDLIFRLEILRRTNVYR